MAKKKVKLFDSFNIDCCLKKKKKFIHYSYLQSTEIIAKKILFFAY